MNLNSDNVIINGLNNCLLASNITCPNDINRTNNSYSSKILANQYLYSNYINKYKEDHKLDPNNKYLVVVKDKDTCNIDKQLINKCSNLTDIDNNHITNTITEESYSLQHYIDNPTLLKNIIMENEKTFIELILSEFNNLYRALIFLHDKDIAHLKIEPNNIIFNQKTKKMKFINFGQRISKNELIKGLGKAIKSYKYEFSIYHPFICFFLNIQNFNNFKNLTNEEYVDFINFLKHTFFDEPYNVPSLPQRRGLTILRNLKSQFISRINLTKEKFEKYKIYIKSQHDSSFFFANIDYLKKVRLKTFLKYTINSIDIFGLSTTLMQFTKMLKNNYPLKYIPNVSNMLITTFKDLSINFPLLSNNSISIYPKKSFIRYRTKHNYILEYLKKTGKNIKPNPDQYKQQYKLKTIDIVPFDKKTTNKYINNNGKLMRAFDADNVFIHLNKLSHHNYDKIKKLIDDNKKYNNLLILINKEAYYKIKYGIYCKQDEEINIYTKKCIQKCPKNYQRDFNDKQFRCLRKSQKKSNTFNIKKSKKIKSIMKKSKTLKKCPSGYERNPFTKKCTKKCLSGYIRNLKFNCIPKKDVL